MTSVDAVIEKSKIEAGDDALEYLLQLERRKYELLKKGGSIDFDALRAKLLTLEAEVANIDQQNLTQISETNGHSNGIAELNLTSAQLDTIVENDTEISSNPSPKKEARGPKEERRRSENNDEQNDSLNESGINVELDQDTEDHHRRSSVRSTGSTGRPLSHGHSHSHSHSHSKPARRQSISQPLYTMPNAFQYGIKLRDTKMNGMSMYEEGADATTSPAGGGSADLRVQGSRERETNIRNITDKFSEPNPATDRSSFSMPVNFTNPNVSTVPGAASAASAEKKRAISSDTGANLATSATNPSGTSPPQGQALARALLSGGHRKPLFEEDDLNQTIDSVNAPKRHSLSDLAEAIHLNPSQEDLHGLNQSGELSPRLSEEHSDSSIPEGAIEFCIVEADWAQLHLQSQTGHLLTPLLPPKRAWRYPPDLDSSVESNTLELQDQSFFFPSGVKVDLVWPSVASLRSRANKHIRHIVPFTDAQGKPTYACVLTVTQTYETSEIAQYGDLIVPNLVTINMQKQAARCIQKCFRQYVAYRKMVSWQLHKAVFSSSTQPSPQLQRTSTTIGAIFGRKVIVDSSTHGSTGTGSVTDERVSNPTVTAAPATSGRRTWSSYFSSGRSSSYPDESSHGSKPTTAPSTPGGTNTSNTTNRNSGGTSSGNNGNTEGVKKHAQRSASVTGATNTNTSTTTTPTASGWRRGRNTADTPTAHTLAATAAELEQAELRRKQQQLEYQAEYVRRRVVVAQKAYCIISSSREYTYIFKVLDAIAAAEGFSESGRQSKAALPFSSTLSDDEDDSSDGMDTARSSSVSSVNCGFDSLNISSVLGVALSPATVPVLPHQDTSTMHNTIQTTNLSHSNSGEDSVIHSMYMRNIHPSTSQDPIHTTHVANATNNANTITSTTTANTNYPTMQSPSLTTPSHKTASISAAVDVFYAQHRAKRDQMRYNFLQDVESFLLDHLTAPVQTALQQITTEFAFSPSAAVVAQGNKYRDFNHKNSISGKYKMNSRSPYGNDKKLRSVDSAYLNQLNSPIMQPTGRKLANMNAAAGGANNSGAIQDTLSTTSSLTTSPRAVPNISNSLTRSALVNAANATLQNAAGSRSDSEDSDNEDVHNRFSHYKQVGYDTTHHIRCPGYIDDFKVDLKALLTTKEWTCAVLFTHLSSQIIFKIINLLLMEKSLIIHGKNAGIVTTITMAVINLISPFLWEGIFVPLVPDNARELFGAPVPLIVGTTSAPRVTDVSSDTAILFLNDDNVTITTHHTPYSTTTDMKFVAWFVRLPEVSADLPSELEMCRRIDYTTSMLCDYIKDQVEYKDDTTGKNLTGKFNSVTTTATATTTNVTNSTVNVTTNSTTNPTTITNAITSTQHTSLRLHNSTTTTVSRITNTIDSLLMSNLPLHILHHVRVLIVAIKRFNYTFCGVVVNDPGSWKRFLKHSQRTGTDEFYPEYFMEPLRNHLEFQDAIVHTQLFVSFMDKLRKEQCLLDTFRRFLADWIYFRTHLRRKHKYMKKMLKELKAK